MSKTPATRRVTLELAALLDALESGTCPVCYAQAEASYRYLDGLFYEQVNDPGVRDALRASAGFCPAHAQQVRTSMNPLGIAILFHDLLGEAQARLRKARPLAGTPRSRRADPWARVRGPVRSTTPSGADRTGQSGVTPSDCPACRVGSAAAEQVAQELLRALADDRADVVAALRRTAFGLCLPHVQQLVRDAGRAAAAQRLVEIQLDLYEKLRERTGQFIEHHDHRKAGERLSRELAGSWRQALEACNSGPVVLERADIRRPRLNA